MMNKPWDFGLDDGDVAPGRSLEMIERAIAVNPALARLGSTEKLKTIVDGAPQKNVEDALPMERDILKAVEQERVRHIKDKAEIDQKIVQLQAERRAATASSLQRVFRHLLAIDPSLVSPKTALVLQKYKPFLDEIGFTVQKLIETQSVKPR